MKTAFKVLPMLTVLRSLNGIKEGKRLLVRARGDNLLEINPISTKQEHLY